MKSLLAITLFVCLSHARAVEVDLEPVVERGIREPVHVAQAPGEPGRHYIVEQRGRILVLENGRLSPFLNIESKVVSGGEQGLLSLTFHPGFTENRRYFLNYTTEKPWLQTVISEMKKGQTGEKELLRIDQPYRNHNGGQNAFGHDGYLYIGMGDGGSGGDPHNYSQNTRSLLGKMLRIDVDREEAGKKYAIPSDNPFASGADGAPEIFAIGLRNPWRFSFDRETGALFTGDVGQVTLEEIDIVEKGKNYGWNIMEATRCYNPPQNCPVKGLTLPIWEYGRNLGISITGGFVYRGTAIPELKGAYLYGDFSSGKIWALFYDQDQKKVLRNELLLNSQLAISSFGEELNGEILVVHHRGQIHRIVPAR